MNASDGSSLGAARLQSMYISPIRIMLDKVSAMERQGISVIRLLAGEPDFPTPEDIKQATIRAINENHTRYGSNRGQPRLRQAIAKILLEDCGVAYDPETELLVTSGGAEAINNAMLSFVNPGDEVILFTPAFVNYENLTYLCGATPVCLPLSGDNGFQIDIAAVQAHITPKTRMIVLNNPCNPTGAVYPRATLEALAHLAVEHNLLVLSDEIYSRMTYNGAFTSMASLPGMRRRTLVINGFSKTFAMTGWRIGYIAADQQLTSLILKTHQYSTTCAPTFIQDGLAEALFTSGTQAAVGEMLAEFARRREVLVHTLGGIAGLSFTPPDGAFYAFVDVSSTGLDGDSFAQRLLTEKLVATVPGGALGKGCSHFVRLSFATSMENLQEGLKRLADFVGSLSYASLSPNDIASHVLWL